MNILGFQQIDKTKLAWVGGKAANLGELSRIKDLQVPEGFCITADAYKKIIASNEEINSLLDQLVILKANDLEAINALSAKIRRQIAETQIPRDLENEITGFLEQMGEKNGYAVRSSATAEDLPTASFAGQHDTYLNIVGKKDILEHIRKCWASLFTDRAVTYRIQNGFDHRRVYLAVVIQKMVFPDAAGIMFTADPLAADRKTVSIDAALGLGEALVSGLVNADNYKLVNGRLIDKRLSSKTLAIHALKNGGTVEKEVGIDEQNNQVLGDEQMLHLELIGRKIEAHFGNPQDIEWCLADDTFYIVQSRPITTLYPIPEGNDQKNRVYISVGHQQMMTDPMKPLGLSLWQLRAARPMFKAGGRLFVDVTEGLAKPADRKNLLEAMEQHDPLIKDALNTIVERGDFIRSLPDDEKESVFVKSNKGMSAAGILAQAGNDPAIVSNLVKQNEASTERLKQNIQTKSGTDLFDFIQEDIEQSKKMIFDSQHMGVIIAAMNASSWINDRMNEWLGEKNIADKLSQSVSNNVTSEMGLALLDVADAIRPHAVIIEYLQQVESDNFPDELITLDGGIEVRDAVEQFLKKYGMRCTGEIDITKPRWAERPATLIPVILANIKNFRPGESKRKFDQGRHDALRIEKDLADRLLQVPDGEQKAAELKQMISLLRNFAGYREYPKYGIVNRFFAYKQSLMKEARQLVGAGLIDEEEDVYYLTFEEFREAVRTHKVDADIIAQRKEEHKRNEKLTPPRVITSDGEIVSGRYKRQDAPADAILGLAVSSGTIEGRARVILNMDEAHIEEGDILVTTFTDPSWTPLFVSIKGLVTEVGGLMTHGAVIAREYGLPAIVGVENATKRIRDGQQIRLNGTDGYVEII